MMDTAIQATLSPEEWALVSALREIPPSPLRMRVMTLLDELMTFLREPKCAEMQADGVPCSDVQAQCDQCVHVAAVLETMTRAAGFANR